MATETHEGLVAEVFDDDCYRCNGWGCCGEGCCGGGAADARRGPPPTHVAWTKSGTLELAGTRFDIYQAIGRYERHHDNGQLRDVFYKPLVAIVPEGEPGPRNRP